MNDKKQEQPIMMQLTDQERRTLLDTAVAALQATMTVFKQFGIIPSVVLPAEQAIAKVETPAGTSPVKLMVPVSTAESDAHFDATKPDTTAPVTKPKPPMPQRDPTTGHFLKRGAQATTPAPATTAPTADKPKAPKVAKPKAPPVKKVIAPSLVDDFCKWFATAPEKELYTVKRGQWECIAGDAAAGRAHVLLFHSALLSEQDQLNGSHIICVRPCGGHIPIFNASRVRYGTSHMAQLHPQEIAEQYGAVPIPFQTIRSTRPPLDLTQLQVHDWSGAEKMIIPPVHYSYSSYDNFRVVRRHFAGAVIVSIKNKCYLFDTDRNELRWCNFNPFFTQLPKMVKTVAEAYDALCPEPVAVARMTGLDVLRQGEFFFVPVSDSVVLPEIAKSGADEFDKRTVAIIYERIDGLGAAVINHQQARLLTKIQEFIDKYPAALPAASNERQRAEYIENVRAELKPLTDTLAMQVGPEVAWLGAKNHAAVGCYGSEGHHGTHLELYNEELTIRLHPELGSDRRFGIRFNQVVAQGVDGRLRDGSTSAVGFQEGHLITATKSIDGALYARGTVQHRGRQHHAVYLPCWHRVYANTAVANWTVHGDVD